MAIDHETADVNACHYAFDLPIGVQGPRFFDSGDVQKRIDFLDEELTEFKEAVHNGDLAKAIDGLIDLVYVAKGTAIMFGVNAGIWAEAWNEVHAANMRKVKTNIDNYHFGLAKPEGWVPPDIEGVLRRHSR